MASKVTLFPRDRTSHRLGAVLALSKHSRSCVGIPREHFDREQSWLPLQDKFNLYRGYIVKG